MDKVDNDQLYQKIKETFASIELLNELINPLSPKTVILFALVIIFVVWLPKLFN